MTLQPEVASLTLALVCQDKLGRWEVRTAHVETESNSQDWRHHRYYATEQLAEAAARALLPYCNTAWHPANELAPGRLAEKVRVPWHKFRKAAAKPPSESQGHPSAGASLPPETASSGAS